VRVRRPELELRATDDTLAVVRIRDGRELGSAAWSAVVAEPRRHVVTGRGRRDTIPVISLAIGGHELRVGAWDPTQRWRGEPEVGRVRSPRWLIGAPAWRRLVAKLAACQRIDAGRLPPPPPPRT